VATAIRIGAPVNWTKAIAAIRESGGDAVTVTDREILAAQKILAQKEGLFVEPASAAPVAHLLKTKRRGRVVCVATGHGLKDPEVILRGKPKWVQIKPDLRSLQRVLR
jgi:threonine synthase